MFITFDSDETVILFGLCKWLRLSLYIHYIVGLFVSFLFAGGYSDSEMSSVEGIALISGAATSSSLLTGTDPL